MIRRGCCNDGMRQRFAPLVLLAARKARFSRARWAKAALVLVIGGIVGMGGAMVGCDDGSSTPRDMPRQSSGEEDRSSEEGLSQEVAQYVEEVMDFISPIQKALRTFEGHSAEIMSADFSPQGDRVLTGSRDHTARLWDAESTATIHQFQGHDDIVHAVTFSPDGRYSLTGARDATARLWDNDTGEEIRRFEGHSGTVSSVDFSPDGRLVLTGSWDGTARLWDVETGEEIRRFQGDSAVVNAVAFSPDGRFIATGGYDRHTSVLTMLGRGRRYPARLWDAETGRELHRFVGHSRAIYAIAFSPDGKRLLTGAFDKTARLWNPSTGEEIRRFEGHSYHVRDVAFSPDGTRALTGSYDRTARIWEVESGQELHRFVGHAYYVRAIAYSPNNETVLTSSWGSHAQIWDATRENRPENQRQSERKVENRHQESPTKDGYD